MFMLCDECHNHFDDTCQDPECPHRTTGTSPLADHVAAMVATGQSKPKQDRRTTPQPDFKEFPP